MTEITSVLIEGFQLPNGAKYLIGVPSIGNVGQLAMDCILCTLNRSKSIKFVGSLESTFVLPMTGYERLGATEVPKLCMPIEVYQVAGQNLFIVLQRSLCVKGTQKQFSASLLRWLQSVNFDCAVILTGASTEELDLANSRIFHVSDHQTHLSDLEALLNGSLHIPAAVNSSSNHPTISTVEIDDLMNLRHFSASQGSESSLPLGMTTARYLLESSLSTSGDAGSVKGRIVVVGKFVSEGDNLGDGLELALRVLNGFVLAGQKEALSVRSLVHPESWSRRYGGGLRDTTMFE